MVLEGIYCSLVVTILRLEVIPKHAKVKEKKFAIKNNEGSVIIYCYFFLYPFFFLLSLMASLAILFGNDDDDDTVLSAVTCAQSLEKKHPFSPYVHRTSPFLRTEKGSLFYYHCKYWRRIYGI